MCLVSEVGLGTTFWFDLPIYEVSVVKSELSSSDDQQSEDITAEDAIAPVTTAQATPKESA